MTCKYCGGAGFVEVDVGQIFECNMCLAEQKEKRLGYQYVTADHVVNDPYDPSSDILIDQLKNTNDILDRKMENLLEQNARLLAHQQREYLEVNKFSFTAGLCCGIVLMFVLGFVMLSLEGYI